MSSPLPEEVWKMSSRELLDLLDREVIQHNRKKVYFYAPSFMYYKTRHYISSSNSFPTISITGNSCSLRCKHCEGTVLETMYAAPTPRKLFELCTRLKEDGARGCLISGGCTPSGEVPIDKFTETIAKIKHQLKLTVFVHTGIIKPSTAKALKEAGVDVAMIDVIGSNDTIKQIYNLDMSIEHYADSLQALHESNIKFVPHVIVGLQYGKLDGELQALQIIRKYEPTALVIIAFMPIHGTVMQNVIPPLPVDIARVIATARLMFPRTALGLGCMRPKNKDRHKTEVLALKAGADAIAFPTEETIEFAKSQGYQISFSSMCCSQIHLDIAM